MNNNKLLIMIMIIALILFLGTYFISEKYTITSILCFITFILLINRSNKVFD